MRPLLVAALLTACTPTTPPTASAPPTAPEAAPAQPAAEEPAAQTQAAAASSVTPFADPAAVKAAAGGTVEPMISELSGEQVGETVTRPEASPVGGVPCGPVVHVYDDSWGCEVTEAFTHGGHTSTGWTSLHYGNGARANLNAQQLVPPKEHLDVSGVSCQDWAHLHPDGSLGSCALREPHTFGAVPLPAKTDVVLRADGSVESAVVYEDVTLAGTSYEAGTFQFGADGKVAHHNAGWFGD